MNEKQFVTWMQGFVAACSIYQPTPVQWDELVDTLKKVKISSTKNSIFDSEKKTVFDLGHVKVPKNHWKTNEDQQQKQLLND